MTATAEAAECQPQICSGRRVACKSVAAISDCRILRSSLPAREEFSELSTCHAVASRLAVVSYEGWFAKKDGCAFNSAPIVHFLIFPSLARRKFSSRRSLVRRRINEGGFLLTFRRRSQPAARSNQPMDSLPACVRGFAVANRRDHEQ